MFLFIISHEKPKTNDEIIVIYRIIVTENIVIGRFRYMSVQVQNSDAPRFLSAILQESEQNH